MRGLLCVGGQILSCHPRRILMQSWRRALASRGSRLPELMRALVLDV